MGAYTPSSVETQLASAASKSSKVNELNGGVPRQKGFKCTGGIMASEAVSLLRSFYEQGNPNGVFFHLNF
ncbi:hypothetical protein CsSME_00048463 [Camellia sinensis var. sinensis]